MRYDDIILGGGHNGLADAAYLARAGRTVLVLERSGHIGGAAVSAQAFAGHRARLSRYSYLVSLLPHQVVIDLDLHLQLVRRRYTSYTPVPSDPQRGLLVDTGDHGRTRDSFAGLGGWADLEGWQRFYRRMTAVAQRVFPTVLQPLRSAAQMQQIVADDELWQALTTRPIGALIRDSFVDDTIRGVVATDALIGTFADLDGADLRQNICFLYHLIGGGTGDWDVPVGGMGALTHALARSAHGAGARIRPHCEVDLVDPQGRVRWRQTDGSTGSATAQRIHAAFAPAELDTALAAAGADPVSTGPAPQGAQLKVNLLVGRLPRLRDTNVHPEAAFGGTLHVNEGYDQLQAAYRQAAGGRLPDPLPCEVYCHTLSDRSILGQDLAATSAQTLTVFALHLPADLFRADNDARRAEALAATLQSLNSVLAEPIQDVVLTDAGGAPCIEARTPLDLEHDLRLPGGNIFHRPLQWPWATKEDDVGRWGVETAYPRILLAGAGARRGGGVSAIPGHNAAAAVLAGA